MTNEKLKEIFADEAFVEELFALDTAAEVQAALAAKGLEMTESDILIIRELLIKAENGEINLEQLEQGEGELPEELLEQVSGGIAWGWIIVGILAVCLAADVTHKKTDGRW